MRAAIWVAALGLSACVAAPMSERPAQPSGMVLTRNGVQPVGSDLRVDFGRAQPGVVAAVSKLQGAQPVAVSTNQNCGAGPVTSARWRNGLTLNFQNGAFLGWVVQEPYNGPTNAADNLRIGTGLGDLGVPLEQTTLGREFLKDGIWGLVAEDESQVGTLWSGLTCFFR